MIIETDRPKQIVNDLADLGIESEVVGSEIHISDNLPISRLFNFLYQYDKGIVSLDIYKQRIRLQFKVKFID